MQATAVQVAHARLQPKIQRQGCSPAKLAVTLLPRLTAPQATCPLKQHGVCCMNSTLVCRLPHCSYPYDDNHTIPNSQAVAYNWICMVIAVLVIELLLFRKQHSLTVGITGAVVIYDACSYTVGTLLQDSPPVLVGHNMSLHLPPPLMAMAPAPSPAPPCRCDPPAVVLCHQLCDRGGSGRDQQALLRPPAPRLPGPLPAHGADQQRQRQWGRLQQHPGPQCGAGDAGRCASGPGGGRLHKPKPRDSQGWQAQVRLPAFK